MGANNMNMIVAFVESEVDISISSLKKQLSAIVPDYMIPGYISRIENMPRTPNHKIDTKTFTPQQLSTERSIQSQISYHNAKTNEEYV